VAEPEMVAEPELEAVAEPELEAVAEPELEAVAEPELEAVADPDLEADWAHLLGSAPASPDDADVLDEWSAMAPSLGPDIAPSDANHRQAAASPAWAPLPQQPWQLTPPVPEAEPQRATWPPLGTVFRPTPTPDQPTAHASLLGPRPAPAPAALQRGGPGAGTSSMPSGVRPCIGCELPLSASARFCRRCGRPQG
jgi:hypothetical protein